MDNNVVQNKSFQFSVRIIKLYRFLIKKEKEYNLPKQILRCGTSIGANIEEAIGGQSKKDFIAKMSISYKEARETYYWLKLFRETQYISENQANSLMKDCEEILKLLTSILKTSKKNNTNNY